MSISLDPVIVSVSFASTCRAHNVKTIYLTGTNTDPLLYRHHFKFLEAVRGHGFEVGIRTNGIHDLSQIKNYDKASISVCSINNDVNTKMMGGPAPDVLNAMCLTSNRLKVNIVLGPENCYQDDLIQTLHYLCNLGVPRINLREPYGQPHVGNPMPGIIKSEWDRWRTLSLQTLEPLFGMPHYQIGATKIVYWDVHYVEVESVNLYTGDGRISVEYPITKGCAEDGVVRDQTHFRQGRQQEQWIS